MATPKSPFNSRVWNYLSSTLQEFADVLSAYLPIPTPPEPAYRVYSVLLTQTGTDAPVATVLENTLGLSPTYYYVGPGAYYLEDLAGLFTPNKTFVTGGINFAGGGYMQTYINDANNIEFSVYGVGGTTINDWLYETPFEIRVYN